ncbi:PspC domain-containing protein [Flavobacteriales bacterium]|nr:PspC domain-containing protein [Flavobacteriales bacterium]
MKKTVTVNISGIVFTMDEDAYDQLQQYLNKIRGYFSKSEGKDEIIADIEARIAEMFHERSDDKHQVITLEDVEQMISIMGRPEDFIDVDTDTEEKENTNQSDNQEENTGYNTKRLYRDKEGNVLGGVCSGIGYYFGIDPIWLRLIIVILFFFGGVGFVPYIILWLVIPAANTTAEKLEMKGEKVNIDNIGRAIEDEMKKWSDKFSSEAGSWSNKFEEEVNSWSSKFGHESNSKRGKNRGKTGTIIHRFFDFIIAIITGIIKVFGKLLGLALIVIGAVFLIPIFFSFIDSHVIMSWTETGVGEFSIQELSTLIFGSTELTRLSIIGIALFIGIPAIAIIYGGIRLVLGIKSEIKGLGIVFTTVWIIGLLLLAYSGYRLGIEFKSKSEQIETVYLPQSVGDTLQLGIAKDVIDMSDRKRHRSHGETLSLLILDDEITYNGDVELTILESPTDSFKIEVIKASRGRSRSQALEFVKEINYQFITDQNKVIFEPYHTSDHMSCIRGQEVDIKVFVPRGKSIYIEKQLYRIMYDISNYTNTLDRDMIEKTWTMTDRGLECIGCDPSEL